MRSREWQLVKGVGTLVPAPELFNSATGRFQSLELCFMPVEVPRLQSSKAHYSLTPRRDGAQSPLFSPPEYDK